MRFILISICLSICTSGIGQQRTIDSLLEIVSHDRGDAQTFYALKKLGELTEERSPEQAIPFYRHAMEFPFRMGYAQEFVQVCNSLGELYRNRGLYDSSFLVYRQARALAQKFDFRKELAISDQGIGLNFVRLSQNDSARYYYDQMIIIAAQINDLSLQASGNNNLGNVSLGESNYAAALERFIKAADLFEKIGNNQGMGRALANIGNIENITGHLDRALVYTHRAIEIFEKIKSEVSVAYCHRLLGRIYRKQAKYDSALVECAIAAKIYSATEDLFNEGETYQTIGNIYFDQHKYKESLAESERAIRIARRILNISQLAYSFSSMGATFHQLKQYERAILYFDSSIIMSRAAKTRYLIMDAYLEKSNIYEEQSQLKKALEFHQLYATLKDSLNAEENTHTVEELEAKYQNTKKQAEIELLHKDRELKNISLKQSRTVQTALITAFVLLIIIGLLVSSRNRMINQAKRQMEIERVRNQIARDLHDDMGSTLSSINLISQVAINEKLQESQLKYFQKIGEQSSKMMESMSDMVWSINPDNDNIQKTVVRMKEFSAEILEPKNIGYEFKVDETLNPISLDVAKRKNLFLVFKEAINNAAKYSDGTFVKINLSQNENELLLSISDNGKGFDISNPPNGNGLRNMKARAKEISAKLDFSSSGGSGTSLVLNMPLT